MSHRAKNRQFQMDMIQALSLESIITSSMALVHREYVSLSTVGSASSNGKASRMDTSVQIIVLLCPPRHAW